MRAKGLSLAVGLLLFLYSGSLARADDISSILTGKVIPTVTRPVPMPFNAIVEEVLVKPGTPVDVNSPLIRFRLQEEAMRQIQREVNTGAASEELKAQILSLQSQLATTNAERNKTRQLVATGLGSRQALNRLDETVKSMNNRIDLMRTTLKKNENNFQARLRELEEYFGSPIKEGETLPQILTLSSPIKGYVLSLAPALNPGQLIGAGTSPVQVGQLNPALVQIPVYEAEINNIEVGDPVTVEIPALKNRKFKGIVSEISWISNDLDVANPSYYTVEVTVPNPDLALKPGFKAVVSF
ncbi:MAG: efflux RND transporter periplasmic adaptor subunit [Desulfovibrio sp.]|nr:efflux RND transporter periplasmic adaptor subunit [Desulfovibrio sp.]